MTELIPLWGEIYLKLRPQYKILVPPRGYFQNFRRAPPSFLDGSLPRPGLSVRSFPKWINPDTRKLIDHLLVSLLFSMAL